MMNDLVAAAKCFSEILPNRDIKAIRNWMIEYAPNTIQDRTAFDVYVEYQTSKRGIGVIEAYEELLTDKGKETFHAITYEDFFNILRKYYTSSRNKTWIDYLETRYTKMIL